MLVVVASAIVATAVIAPIILITAVFVTAVVAPAIFTLAAFALAIFAPAIFTLAVISMLIAAMGIILTAVEAVIAARIAIALLRGRAVAAIGHVRLRWSAAIERSGETLAHILHIDIGHRNFAAADTRSLTIIHRGDDAVIVIGVLQEVFSSDPVAGDAGIAGQLQVLFQHLIDIAT